jgi:hypothetical protein
MEYYQINAHPYTFHAIVHLPKKGGTWRIQIGGAKTCVIFNIEKSKSHTIGYLEGLSYYPECAINKTTKMTRGTGTTRLLKAALTFVYEYLSEVNIIYFQDTSMIDCNIESDTSLDRAINLHMFYVSKKGKTWYEEVIGAQLDTNLMVMYESQKQAALGRYQESCFKEFVQKYMEAVVNVFPLDVMEIIEHAYVSHSTYRGMFSELARDYDCAIMYKWLDKYFRQNVSVLFRGHDWHVNRELFNKASIEWGRTTTIPLMKPLPHFGGARASTKCVIRIARVHDV